MCMISKAPKVLGQTGLGQVYNQRDNLGITKVAKNYNKTAVGGAVESDEVKKIAKQTGAAKIGQRVGNNARSGLQNVQDDY